MLAAGPLRIGVEWGMLAAEPLRSGLEWKDACGGAASQWYGLEVYWLGERFG